MLEKTRGIVLKSLKYSETSLITNVFTERFGQLTFLVPGIRKSKSGKGNLLQPGQLLEIDCYYRENKNFQRFREFKVAYIPQHIHTDIRKFSVLTFLIELTGQLVNDKEENAVLFAHIFKSVVYIDQTEIAGLFPVRQLLDISRIMGFYPSDNFNLHDKYFNLMEGSFQEGHHGETVLDESESLLFHRLFKGETVFSNTERSTILEKSLDYFRLHIPGFRELKSREVLHEVLA